MIWGISEIKYIQVQHKVLLAPTRREVERELEGKAYCGLDPLCHQAEGRHHDHICHEVSSNTWGA